MCGINMHNYVFIGLLFVLNEIISPISLESIMIAGTEINEFRKNFEKNLNTSSITTELSPKLTEINFNEASSMANAMLQAKDDRDKVMLLCLIKQDMNLEKMEQKFREIEDQYKQFTGTELMKADYSPHNNNCMEDLIFALIRDPMQVKIAYLTSLLLDNQSYSYGKLLIQMLIIEDTNRKAFIDEYSRVSVLTFEESVELFHHKDYKNFLFELAKKPRAPDVDNVDQEELKRVLKKLNKERKGRERWDDDRDWLDDVLMGRPRKFAQELIKKYGHENGNQLKDDIAKNIQEENLVFGYQSLCEYINDPYLYMASRIHDTVEDCSDFRATFFQLLVLNRNNEQELAKINEAFAKQYSLPITSFLMDYGDPTSCGNDAICQAIVYIIYSKLQSS